MKRHGILVALAATVIGSSLMVNVVSAEDSNPYAKISAEVQAALDVADKEIDAARAAIDTGKQLLETIPEDSPLMKDVSEVVEAASKNWKAAVESLAGAKESASKIAGAPSESVAADYALLAKVNSSVAVSGANVVKIAVTYVEAVAGNKTESIGVIRTVLKNAVASSSQVQFNYDRVKSLIAQKYSK